MTDKVKLQKTLDYCKGNKTKAAKMLGMARSTFREQLDRAGIESSPADKPKPVEAPIVITQTIKQQLKDIEKKSKKIEEERLRAEDIREYLLELPKAQPSQPKWLTNRKDAPYHHGVPNLFLSDIHYGEVVFPEQVFNLNKFNSEICAERIKRVTDTTIHLTHDILKNPQFPGIVLTLGGDMINGDIHEEIQIGSDRRIMAQTIEISDHIHAVIQRLQKVYGRVFVVGVAGNHGRTTRKPMAKFYAETNYDWLCYQMLERFNRGNENVQFLTPAARDVTFRVAGRAFRLTHGDQFKGGDSIIGAMGPVTRGDKKKRAVNATFPTRDEDYETLMVGHFHSLYATQRLIMNGDLKGLDEYAMSCNFDYQPPQQALFLTHEKYGINHFMPVQGDAPAEKKARSSWVEWQK